MKLLARFLRDASLCLTVVLVGSSCDTCGTTVGCSRSPAVGIVGQIVDENTGRPVSNVRVEVRQQSGVTLQPAMAATTSRADGVFEMDLAAADVGPAVVSIVVATPGKPSYTVPDIRTEATTVTGAATVLRPWVSAHPRFPYVIVLWRDPSLQDGVPNASVQFDRTSGPLMLSGGTPISRVQGKTDQAGWLYLLTGITADRTGDVVGDLTIRLPVSGTVLILRDVRFTAVPIFGDPNVIIVIPTGAL